MHRGKWADKGSIEEALMVAPDRAVSESARVESGIAKLLDR